MSLGVETTVPRVQYSLLGGDRMMHVEALQWPNRIFTRGLRAKCHQLYEHGNTTNAMKEKTSAATVRLAQQGMSVRMADQQEVINTESNNEQIY